MNSDPKDPKIPELHEILPLWMLDKSQYIKEIEKEILPIEQRRTAQEMINAFDF